MQRDRTIRGIQCLSATPCLGIHRSARCDEPRDVGDRVANGVSGPRALEVEGLIEVARPFRVQRCEGDVAKVDLWHGGGGCLGLGDDLVGEVEGSIDRFPQPGECRGQLGLRSGRGDV